LRIHNGFTRPFGLRILGAPVYVHWSVYAVAVAIAYFALSSPLHGILIIFCYFSIIFVHEVGHAYMVWKQNYRLESICILFLHGYCTFEEPYRRRDDALIVWGGVLAQLILALCAGLAVAVTGFDNRGYMSIIFTFLVITNLIVAALTLYRQND
jgi:Zn-dependent protease